MSEKEIDIQNQEQEVADISELINPFPGLRPFSVEESHLFFGREGQSDEALVKLSENRFVAILGASGSGKSSFMFCGLIPTLHGGFMTSAGSNWNVIMSRPGGGPIDNLAESILSQDTSYNSMSEEDKLIKRTIVGTVLRSSSLGLVEVLRQMRPDASQNTLILIDQFEELFRFSKLEAVNSDQNESVAFVNLLLEAANHPDLPLYVSITMRSDFIGECAKYMELTQMINDSHYLIPQMVRDQKRMAIEGPVAVGGGKIAPRLTQQLLNDVGDNPDQLPILQHALMRTWSYWVDHRKPDQAMDLEHYNAIGTLRQALSQHANEAFDYLNKREKQIAEAMFKALTEKGAENTGVRRPTKLSTIAAITGVSEDEVERVVNRFREPGRSLLMPPHGVDLNSDTVIDISHESLMRIWDRLKQWLEEESKAAEMYIKLSDASRRFQEGKASLWQMPDLQLAINWREENKPTLVWGSRYDEAFERTMVFLETSEKAYLTEQHNREVLQKRKVKVMRITALILGGAAMFSLFFVVYANIQAGFAEEATKEAEENLVLAVKNEKRAEEQTLRATEAAAEAIFEKNRAELQKEEADKAKLVAQRQSLIAQRQTRIAREEKKNAEAARDEADMQRLAADQARKDAIKEKEAADSARAAAVRLRFQSVAQSMAVKARAIPDPQLKGLVAKQGYTYYMEFKEESKEYNGDIYEGSYYGLQGLIVDKIYQEHPELGARYAKEKGDSTLNQYHGHKPENDFETQVAVRSVTFSQDGKSLYSAGGDGRLLKWSYEDRSFTEVYKSEKVHRVVNVSPNERWLALATNEDEIDLFDLSNPGSEPRKLHGHTGSVYDLVFYRDNSGFISIGADKKILASDFKTETELTTVTGVVKTLAISPDGKTLAAGAQNGEIILIDLDNLSAPQRQIFRKDAKSHPVNDLSFSNDGKFLAIGGSNIDNGFGYVRIWDLEHRDVYGPELVGFTSPVNDVEFSPDGKLIAAASSDKTVRFWDMDANNIFDLPTVLDDHTDWVFDLSFHPEGNYIVTASKDGLIRNFPTKPDEMADQLCNYINHNMSDVEWRQYVADPEDIIWVETCEGKPKKEEIE